MEIDIFERLSDKYGNMTAACEALGFTMRSVQHWKSGKAKIGKRHATAIADDLGLAISTVKRSINKREENAITK